MKTRIGFIIFFISTASCAPQLRNNLVSSSELGAQFQGWTKVMALGSKTVKQTPQPLTPAATQIQLSWNPLVLQADGTLYSPDKYRIYRSSTKGGTSNNSNATLAGQVDGNILSFNETATLPVNTYYYYRIVPLYNEVELNTQEADAELEVFTPSNNTALVHRWMANQDMCKLLGESAQIDRTKNYQCPYTGPGNLGYTGAATGSGYFDFGSSYLVDSYESGCNYSLTSCAAGPCLGTVVPTASDGDVVGAVFFNRGDSKCYIKTDPTTWVDAENATQAELVTMTTNMAGNPALTMVGQDAASLACQGFSIPNIAGVKNLLSRKLFIASAAWDDSISIYDYGVMETGVSLDTGNGYCNSDQGNGLDWAAETNAIPNNYELITGFPASNAWALRTGSVATKNCVSKYGIQDLIGNAWEINSDDIQSNTDGTAVGLASISDATNTDFKDVQFSTQALIADPSSSGNAGYLKYAEMFLPTLGIPLSNGTPSWYQARTFGSGAGQFDSTILNDDYDMSWFISSTIRSVSSGGSFAENFLTGSPNGRFAFLAAVTITGEGNNVGFRCSIPVK
jgi:hypothetical protein